MSEKGYSVEVDGDRAEITVLDPAVRGEVMRKLTEATADIKIDTGGTHRSYLVSADDAKKAGLLRTRRSASDKSEDE